MRSTGIFETQLLARQFIDAIKSKGTARVVALHGDLGSGKTTFAQGVATVLGVDDTVQSPTFVIEKIYETKHPIFTKLIHIDAYRLEAAEELSKLGWDDIVADTKNLILVEWPERVADIMPDDADIIRFEFIDENIRDIEIEYGR
jgi:tRNA threonylcarbamoyladenosine biosynthesis protein TsaE